MLSDAEPDEVAPKAYKLIHLFVEDMWPEGRNNQNRFDEVMATISDVARRFVELDLGIPRITDPDRPRHWSKQWTNPDAGSHDDNLQRAKEMLLSSIEKILTKWRKDGKAPEAYMKTLLRPLVRDYSTRTTGWALTEWDARTMYEANKEAKLVARDLGDIDRLTREIYIERGGDKLVYDQIYGQPLSFEFEMDDAGVNRNLHDVVPDSSPGPEQLVLFGDEPSPIQRTLEDYVAEELNEAERDFVDLLRTNSQAKVANILHMSEGRVSQKVTKLREDYASWKQASVKVEPEDQAEPFPEESQESA